MTEAARLRIARRDGAKPTRVVLTEAGVTVSPPFDAWARATMPGQKVSGAYMQIRSDVDARLVGVSSPAVPRVEVHEMKMDGDVMRMREVSAVEVPAGKSVELKPGGLHIMLMGLKAPLKQGDKFPLKLKFEKAGEVTVTVNVEGPGASHDMKH